MPNGYLKYTDLCNMLQLTAASHLIWVVLASDMQEFNQAWVLSKMRVEITELPKWRDIVTVKTWVNPRKVSRSCTRNVCERKKIVGSTTFGLF
jgi:acyl-ACP thioesterase